MLSENMTIRKLLASLGFSFRRDPEGGDIVLFDRTFVDGAPVVPAAPGA